MYFKFQYFRAVNCNHCERRLCSWFTC